jgi:hypothetical protein
MRHPIVTLLGSAFMSTKRFVLSSMIGVLAGCGMETGTQLTQVDPASQWSVQPLMAAIAGTDGGQAWDIDNSAPDIVVKLGCPASGRRSSSETIEVESYNPTWAAGGCVSRADDLVDDGLEIEVFDVDDALDSDDDVVETTLTVRESDLLAGMVMLGRAGDLDSLTIKLTKQ